MPCRDRKPYLTAGFPAQRVAATARAASPHPVACWGWIHLRHLGLKSRYSTRFPVSVFQQASWLEACSQQALQLRRRAENAAVCWMLGLKQGDVALCSCWRT